VEGRESLATASGRGRDLSGWRRRAARRAWAGGRAAVLEEEKGADQPGTRRRQQLAASLVVMLLLVWDRGGRKAWGGREKRRSYPARIPSQASKATPGMW
jgi:hypothetical protein